jgi:hypothetical protein
MNPERIPLGQVQFAYKDVRIPVVGDHVPLPLKIIVDGQDNGVVKNRVDEIAEVVSAVDLIRQ